jgi:queuine tRNA-ribosyltransferase
LGTAKRTLAADTKSTEFPNFSFEVLQKDSFSNARTGILRTPHGNVETSNFVFCATKAAMKAITPTHLREEGSQICLSNTYHLMLTPGPDLIEKMGGLQKFTSWNGPMCKFMSPHGLITSYKVL